MAGGGNPVDGASNVVLTDSLSGMHTDGSNNLKTVMVATGGAISLTDNNNTTTTPTGLRFTQRTGDGAGKEATITGTLAAGTAGTFNLTYTVVDGDRNVKGKCTSANTPVDCDTATVDVTLTVTDPMISLAGGNLPATDAVVLEKGVDLTAAITLPMVGGNVSAPGNISYVLTSKRTHDVSGNEIGNQTLRAVDDGDAAVPGLTYTEAAGMGSSKTPGKLNNTSGDNMTGPTEAGTWELTYTVTDNNDTASNTADDLDASITFTVQVVTDDMPVLDSDDVIALTRRAFTYRLGEAVGTDADTAFPLPGFTGGNGDKTESLTTECTGSGCMTDSDVTPKGLTFTASSGDTPAGLTGAFGSPGTYTVTYTVTDTKIPNSVAYQPADVVDSPTVTFTLVVGTDAKPTLSSTDDITRAALQWRDLTINLPVASGGNPANGASNVVLTDTLSGMHTPLAGGSTAGILKVESNGVIKLANNTVTGLTFRQRTGDADNARAKITGTPEVTGTFVLEYKVVDGDDNEVDCDSEGAPSGCDTVMMTVTLTLTEPMLTFNGGNVKNGDSILLKKNVNLSTPITLPTAGGSDRFSIAYNPSTPTVSGLNLNLQNRTLSGRPTQAGTWVVTYTETDTTPNPDVVGSVRFTVQVVADSNPDLEDDRVDDLQAGPFNYVTGSTVGEGSSTAAFEMPAITAGGYGAKTESLTTCKLLNNDCDPAAAAAAAVDTDSSGNKTPKGLTFTAASEGTPAGLAGTFATAGTYRVTYSVTDTPIVNDKTFQTEDDADTASVTFILEVAANSVPELASSKTEYDGANTREVEITLPVASNGNFGLTDSLSGTHQLGTGTTATAVKVAENGDISLSDDTATGLRFINRTVGTNAKAATIMGTLEVTGIFVLDYKVEDRDSRTVDCADVSNPGPSNCDTATVSVTLEVTEPALKLDGGNVGDNTIVTLKLNKAMTIPINLPPVTAGATSLANISYALSYDPNPTTGVPGLNYSSSAGTLMGTPTMAGTWELTYTATDSNGSPGDNTDDVVDDISFTVKVVADVGLTLGALSGLPVNNVTGGAVGVDADTPFALPGFTGGNTPIVESLTTTCTGNTCMIDEGVTPKGLTFTASSGSTPAGLTGIFDNAGTYTVTYTVTDAVIADGTYQSAEAADVVTAPFTLMVAPNSEPTLTPPDAINEPDLFTTRPVDIPLPVAAGGDNGLTESLTGTFDPDGPDGPLSATDVGVSGSDILTDGTKPATTSGLRFTNRTVGMNGAAGTAATITGIPTVAGTFVLKYKVVDGDRNVKSSDTEMVPVTLTVAVPKLTLTDNEGDVAGNEMVWLVQGVDTAMTLPTETEMSNVSGSGNISRVLKAHLALSSSGMLTGNLPAVVMDSNAALPGLTYTAHSGSTAGTLTGKPTPAAGIWTMTYIVTDNNGTPEDTSDDLVQTIDFGVGVVADSVPDLANGREEELSDQTFNYLVGDTVGASSNMKFLLPVVTGGNGEVTERLQTTCAPSCSSDVNTINASVALPKGLTYTVAAFESEDSPATAAGMSGTFSSPGTYTVTYTVTDTALANSNYQTADVADVVPVTFTMEVQTDSVPTLTGVTEHTLLKDRSLTIDLPEASDGNFALTDSLSGRHTPVDGSATAVTVDMTAGATFGDISLSGGAASGLKFTARTPATMMTPAARATITGTPKVTGTFVLEYKVVDGDSNEGDCTGAGTPSGCDTATETVTLTVTDPALLLTGGNVANDADVVLKKGVELTEADITLPTVTGDVSDPGNISYVLTSTQMAGGSGAAPVTAGLNAVAGLTYTAHSGSTAGTLSGTPSAAAGTWTLTYQATDNNATSSDTSDDKTASISFTVQVVADTVPKLASLGTFNRVTGGTVGADADTAFPLPVIVDGNGAKTESLTTACTGSGCMTDSDVTPKGLTFMVSSSGTPAGLKGVFGNAGTYTVTYTVTDTAIANSSAYQTPDIADDATVEFTLEVAQNSAPTLTSLGAINPGFTTREVTITLPVAGGGNPVDGASNAVLTDSLSGRHTPVDGSATDVTVDMTESVNKGLIRLSNGNTTGLRFTQRAGDGAGKEATIEGTLEAGTAGTFNLTYTVVDGDRNVNGECTSANTPPDCDTAEVDVTLVVMEPGISLAGGNVLDNADVVLVQSSSVVLSKSITLPTVTGDVSAPGNISYVLTSTQMANGSGAVAVADASTVVAGLTYSATAGTLSGTPSAAAGTWTLTYQATDNNATLGDTSDDKTASISFTVQVVADTVPSLAALSGSPFDYVVGEAVGADSNTAFVLPAITARGNGAITESLGTNCASLSGSSCTGAVTTGSNPAPTGLTFAASAGSTPAGLTGTFGNSATYTVTYTVTDTPIANTTTYQPADTADPADSRFHFCRWSLTRCRAWRTRARSYVWA